jgi:negative regulator of genetic competence, sporulation and motility
MAHAVKSIDLKNKRQLLFIPTPQHSLPIWRVFMTVKAVKYKNNRYKSNSDYLYIFENIEALNNALLFLYRLKKGFKSALYKTDKDYRLIITSYEFYPYLLTLSEYCQTLSKSIIDIELTREYAKVLIEKNAVRTYAKYFFKGI